MVINENIQAQRRFLVLLIFSNIPETKIISKVEGIYMYRAMFAQPPTQKSLPTFPPKFAKEMNNQITIMIEASRKVSSFRFDLKEEKQNSDAKSIGDTKNIPTGENKDPKTPPKFSQVDPVVV